MSMRYINAWLDGQIQVRFPANVPFIHPNGSLIIPSLREDRQTHSVWVSVGFRDPFPPGDLGERPTALRSLSGLLPWVELGYSIAGQDELRPTWFTVEAFWQPYVLHADLSQRDTWLYSRLQDARYITGSGTLRHIKADAILTIDQLMRRVENTGRLLQLSVGLYHTPPSPRRLCSFPRDARYEEWIMCLQNARQGILDWLGYVSFILRHLGPRWRSLQVFDVDFDWSDEDPSWSELIDQWQIAGAPVLGAIVDIHEAPQRTPFIQQWIYHEVPYHYIWGPRDEQNPFIGALNPSFYPSRDLDQEDARIARVSDSRGQNPPFVPSRPPVGIQEGWGPLSSPRLSRLSSGHQTYLQGPRLRPSNIYHQSFHRSRSRRVQSPVLSPSSGLPNPPSSSINVQDSDNKTRLGDEQGKSRVAPIAFKSDKYRRQKTFEASSRSLKSATPQELDGEESLDGEKGHTHNAIQGTVHQGKEAHVVSVRRGGESADGSSDVASSGPPKDKRAAEEANTPHEYQASDAGNSDVVSLGSLEDEQGAAETNTSHEYQASDAGNSDARKNDLGSKEKANTKGQQDYLLQGREVHRFLLQYRKTMRPSWTRYAMILIQSWNISTVLSRATVWRSQKHQPSALKVVSAFLIGLQCACLSYAIAEGHFLRKPSSLSGFLVADAPSNGGDSLEHYRHRMEAILTWPQAKVLLWRGGLVWRLAIEFGLPIQRGLEPPVAAVTDNSERIRHLHASGMLCEVLTKEEVNVVLGVNGDQSLWPTFEDWEASIVWIGEWDSQAEYVFMCHLRSIQTTGISANSLTRQSWLRRLNIRSLTRETRAERIVDWKIEGKRRLVSPDTDLPPPKFSPPLFPTSLHVAVSSQSGTSDTSTDYGPYKRGFRLALPCDYPEGFSGGAAPQPASVWGRIRIAATTAFQAYFSQPLVSIGRATIVAFVVGTIVGVSVGIILILPPSANSSNSASNHALQTLASSLVTISSRLRSLEGAF
ncbi:hypothetical protein OF83DRAFT_1177677 [Amylostereum chailletii]|nr:hypothetical protein OF83DRAFT_1177677 [Amylostereum chailletii]